MRIVPCRLKRFEEAKTLLRKTMPVARRVLGENNTSHAQDEVDLRAGALQDPAATLDDLREAVTTLGGHRTDRAARVRRRAPVREIERDLRNARARSPAARRVRRWRRDDAGARV